VPPLSLALTPAPVVLLLVPLGLGVLTPVAHEAVLPRRPRFFRADPTDGPGVEDHANLPLALCATAPT
jgi:hypothetical protein